MEMERKTARPFPEYKWCLGDLVVTRSPTNESLMNVTSQSEGLDEVALQR